MNKEKIIAIIPARGGSKGIPRKNIKLLAGKPLIAYSIENALKSKFLDRVIVSTENEEIADISKKYKAEVYKRPNELASDTTSTINVLFHVLDVLRSEKYIPDSVMLLQPTSPLRTTEDIDNVIKIFSSGKYESVIGVCESDYPPYLSLKIENDKIKPLFGWKCFKSRRQDMPKTYSSNGSIFISAPKSLHKNFFTDNTFPYIMPLERSIDIDNKIDFLLTELLIKKNYEIL